MDHSTDSHPSSEDLAAYLSDGLDAAETAQLDNHLADCAVCREQLIGARRLLDTAPRRRNWSFAVAGLAAAAVIVVFLLPRSGMEPSVDSVRGAEEELAPGIAIEVVAPDESVSLGGPVRFIWHGMGDRPLYRLTLTDGAGEEIWTTDTRDTVATLPIPESLAPGVEYFWYVDALGTDVRSRSSGLNSFVAQP